MSSKLTFPRSALLLSTLYAGVCVAGGAMHGAAPSIKLHQNFQQPVVPQELRWRQHPLSDETLKQIAHLRDEGLVLQKLDGGKLTHAHRDYLQQKLDAIYQNAH